MTKFAVFDLDGTLLNTLPDISGAMNRVLSRHGLPQHPEDSYRRFTGNGARLLTLRALAGREALLDIVYPQYLKEYSANSRVLTRPYDGVTGMLHSLSVLQVKLIVYSNKDDPEAKDVIRYYFPDVPFAAVLGSLPDKPLKPDPAALNELLSSLSLRPDDGIYLGDTVMDIQCAKAAGLYAVAAGWGFQTREELMKEQPDRLLVHPDEVLTILKERFSAD